MRHRRGTSFTVAKSEFWRARESIHSWSDAGGRRPEVPTDLLSLANQTRFVVHTGRCPVEPAFQGADCIQMARQYGHEKVSLHGCMELLDARQPLRYGAFVSCIQAEFGVSERVSKDCVAVLAAADYLWKGP